MLEKGDVPWAEILRDPKPYLGLTLTLDCQGARITEFPALRQSNGVARLPRGDNAGRYRYGLSLAAGGDVCALVSASRLPLPPGNANASLTGVWTRFGTNWNRTAEGDVYGLRLTRVSFTHEGTNEWQVGYPLHPQFDSVAAALFERTENLIDVLTQYVASAARQRYAKLFSLPMEAQPALVTDMQKRIAEGFEANDRPDGDLLKGMLELHDTLSSTVRQLGDQQNDTSFAVQRVRTADDVIFVLRNLCDGKFPGRIEAERFRLWFASRLIVFGDLLDAQAAMGPCTAPLALDTAYGPTCGLLRTLGERLSDFEIVKEDGSRVASKSLRGKWVVLYFKMSERPSNWRSFYRNFIRQLESMETSGELNITHVVVPLNRNLGAEWLNKLGIKTEPQIVILSPGGHVCYFNSPANPQIPQEEVFRAWILDRSGGHGRAGRVLQTLGIQETDVE